MFLFLVTPIYSSRMQQEGIISIDDDKGDADVSDDDSYEPAGKKVRVSTASVHNEFVQRKEAFASTARSKTPSINTRIHLLSSFIWRRNIQLFTKSVWRKIKRKEKEEKPKEKKRRFR